MVVTICTDDQLLVLIVYRQGRSKSAIAVRCARDNTVMSVIFAEVRKNSKDTQALAGHTWAGLQDVGVGDILNEKLCVVTPLRAVHGCT